jgi:hypothetical protein
VVDDDAVDFVGDVFEGVGYPLEILEHLPSYGELQRVSPSRLERAPETRCMDIVSGSFESDKLASQPVQLRAIGA